MRKSFKEMRKLKVIYQKLLLIGLTLSVYLVAQPTIAGASEPLKGQDQVTLKKIQDYLNGIRTLRATFMQRNSNGETTSGKMYLKRLGRESYGKLRLDYNPPAKIKIIANGETLRQEDGETQEVSEYSIDDTPASFLLRHKIDFSNDLEVQKMETRGGKVHLSVTKSGNEGLMLTLIFVTSPLLKLQEWDILDNQGNKTHVTLQNVEIGIPIDDHLFR